MGDEILKTIIKQMKAQDRDFKLYGAKFMKVKDNKLRVHMKRGTKVRNIDVELTPMDLYDVEDSSFSTSMRNKNPFKVTTKKHKGLFFDQFGDLLEGNFS